MKLSILAIALASASSVLFAQSVVQVELVGQALVYSDAGAVKGCGVRVLGLLPSSPTKKKYRFLDVSANVWKPGIGMVKMVVAEVPQGSDPSTVTPVRFRLKSGWLKAEGKRPAAPSSGTFKESTDDARAYLFTTDVQAALDFIGGAVTDIPVQVAVRWEEPTEWVFASKVKMTDEDRRQVSVCIDELVK